MKKFLILFVAIFFVACSQRSSVLTLTPYAQTGDFNANKAIFIEVINDKRANKSIIASVQDKNGNVDEYVVLQNDLTAWFLQGLKNELKIKGVNVADNEIDASAKAAIDIGTANAEIKGFGKENMSGKAEIFITIKKGETRYTKRVAQSQSEFAAIPTGGAFTPFVENMLKDVIKKSAEQIANTL